MKLISSEKIPFMSDTVVRLNARLEQRQSGTDLTRGQRASVVLLKGW